MDENKILLVYKAYKQYNDDLVAFYNFSDFNKHLCTICPISLAKNVWDLWIQCKNSTIKCLYISINSVIPRDDRQTNLKKSVPSNGTAEHQSGTGRRLVLKAFNKKVNKMTFNVAFKMMVTYTKKVIETWKRLQLDCHRVFLNISTIMIGAHHNGGLLFVHDP